MASLMSTIIILLWMGQCSTQPGNNECSSGQLYYYPELLRMNVCQNML